MRQASLPLEHLQAWADLHRIHLNGVSPASVLVAADGTDKGGGLLAQQAHAPGEPLVVVPLKLFLSQQRVEEYATTDDNLRQVIEAAASLYQNPRTAMLLFLIYQMTVNRPGQPATVGTENAFADYLRFLPKQIPLPTFYTPEERGLLAGTSLVDALDQKLASLEHEFAELRAATQASPWCRAHWWDGESEGLTLDDWKLADALYRSRALELPRGAGVGMVPVVDLANHASDDQYNARFEVDEPTGGILLLARDGRPIRAGDEVTIMYGAGGACEMIFSYGFVEEQAGSAREMFLALSIPDDDPLRRAKLHFGQEAPGVRLFIDDQGQVCWDSAMVWWACVNQEDGLDFQVEQARDGATELRASWKGDRLTAEALQSALRQDALRDVFVLRAVVTIQQRVEEQGTRLAAGDDVFDRVAATDQVRRSVASNVRKLRGLELDLLTRAYEALEQEKTQLLESAIVRAYLEHRLTGDDAAE